MGNTQNYGKEFEKIYKDNEPNMNDLIKIIINSKLFIDKYNYKRYEFKFVEKIDENHIKFMNTGNIYKIKRNLMHYIYIEFKKTFRSKKLLETIYLKNHKIYFKISNFTNYDNFKLIRNIDKLVSITDNNDISDETFNIILKELNINYQNNNNIKSIIYNEIKGHIKKQKIIKYVQQFYIDNCNLSYLTNNFEEIINDKYCKKLFSICLSNNQYVIESHFYYSDNERDDYTNILYIDSYNNTIYDIFKIIKDTFININSVYNLNLNIIISNKVIYMTRLYTNQIIKLCTKFNVLPYNAFIFNYTYTLTYDTIRIKRGGKRSTFNYESDLLKKNLINYYKYMEKLNQDFYINLRKLPPHNFNNYIEIFDKFDCNIHYIKSENRIKILFPPKYECYTNNSKTDL